MTIDVSKMVDIDRLKFSSIEHVDEIISLSAEARQFLESQKWCKKIIQGMFDRGWGYIMAVFYFTIEPAYNNVPDHVWVIVGDLPPAYIDTDDNPDGAFAVEAYVLEMQKWVDNVMKGQSVTELIPVNVPPTKEYARMLQKRLDIIKKQIIKYHRIGGHLT